MSINYMADTCYFITQWAIKFTFVSDALKMCNINVYFGIADNWIGVLPVTACF